MKLIQSLLAMIFATSLLVACGQKEEAAPAEEVPAVEAPAAPAAEEPAKQEPGGWDPSQESAE